MDDTQTLYSSRNARLIPGRVALFVVDASVLAALLAWSLSGSRSSSSSLPFASAFIFTISFLLFLRPFLGAPPGLRAAWLAADTVVLLALNSAVLFLLNPSTLSHPSVLAILLSAAVISLCVALARENTLLSRRSFLAAFLLLSALPVVAWLALAELVGARMDWLFAVSPVAAASTSVIDGVSPAVRHAGALWMIILASILVLLHLLPRLKAKVHGPAKSVSMLLAVAFFTALAAGSARAQAAEPTAKLDLGVNGEIVAGAWNPARIMLSGISGPTRLSLVVDGVVTHDLLVEPDKWTEFLAFIPSEQPVVTLSGPGLAANAVMPALKLRAVETRLWPGVVVTGARSGDLSRLGPLTERAPGVRFLELELADLAKLPSSCMEQFPVVILETAKVEGPPRKDFVRLTEWMSSRTLAIPPESRVRRDWPGLSSLRFESLYGYEALNRGVLDVLSHPRVSLVDPDVQFFGPAADWSGKANRAVLVACLVLIIFVTVFYLLVCLRIRSAVLAALAALAVVAIHVSACYVTLRSQTSVPVVATVVLDESTPASAVALETRIRQISGAPGATCLVDNDAPAGWVPVYADDSQSESNVFHVRPWKGEGPPEVEVTLASGPQILVSTRTKLVAATQPPSSGALLLRIVGGRWSVDADNHADLNRLLNERSSSIRIGGFLDWFASRAPEQSRWSLLFTLDPAPNSSLPTVHVFALRLN